MILNYSYYFWSQALDADLCNKIINHGNSLKEEVGRSFKISPTNTISNSEITASMPM